MEKVKRKETLKIYMISILMVALMDYFNDKGIGILFAIICFKGIALKGVFSISYYYLFILILLLPLYLCLRLLKFGISKIFYEYFYYNKLDILNFKFCFKNFKKITKLELLYLLVNVLSKIFFAMLFVLLSREYPLENQIPIFYDTFADTNNKILFLMAFLIEFCIYSNFFLIKYLLLENINLKFISLLRLNNKLILKRYWRILFYRLYIWLVLIAFLSIKFLYGASNFDMKFKLFTFVILIYTIPESIKKEVLLFKKLKEEAIEKGICKAEEFESQQS